MSETIVSDDQLHLLRDAAAKTRPAPGLSYGRAQDFCDGFDLVPDLLAINQDIKDLQRFWTLRTVLSLVPPGGVLLEIGAGEPIVADILGRLGYRVIVVDPYEGAGNGPVDIDRFRKIYRHVDYRVSNFDATLTGVAHASVDCCYSISVIEHIPLDQLASIQKAVDLFSKPGACSVHCIDVVTAGPGSRYHREMLTRFAGLMGYAESDVAAMLDDAERDPETYLLSVEAHNRWRGSQPYRSFPMRRVMSAQIVGQRSEPSAARQAALMEAAATTRIRQAYDARRLAPLLTALDAARNNPMLPATVDTRLFNDVVMTLNLRDEVCAALFVDKIYEPELTAWLTQALRPGDVFCDVGAHYGYFSVVAADLVGPNGAVHAFEPTARTAAMLRRNLSRWGWAEVIEAAVGECEGDIDINDYGEALAAYNSRLAARLDPAPSAETTTRTPIMTLDKFFAGTRRAPSVVKIDTESSEALVIDGMTEILRHARPLVALECGDFDHLASAGVPTSAALIQRLVDFNYHVFEPGLRNLVPHERRARYDYCNLVFVPA